MTSQQRNTVALLKKARGILARGRWCRKHYTRKGAHCAYGALGRAQGFSTAVLRAGAFETDNTATRALMRVAPNGAVATYNDEVAKSKQDILALYDRAIAWVQAGAVSA